MMLNVLTIKLAADLPLNNHLCVRKGLSERKRQMKVTISMFYKVTEPLFNKERILQRNA